MVPLCMDCPHRDGLMCRHPDLKANGGEGLEIIHPQPHWMHVQTAGKGGRGRSGHWRNYWPGPPLWCAGNPRCGEKPEKEAA